MGRLMGLFVSGVVEDRRRRYIQRGESSVEIVTYTLRDDTERRLFLEDYAPGNYRNIGDQICVPVYIKPYRKKNGDLSYTISIKKDFETRGESF